MDGAGKQRTGVYGTGDRGLGGTRSEGTEEKKRERRVSGVHSAHSRYKVHAWRGVVWCGVVWRGASPGWHTVRGNGGVATQARQRRAKSAVTVRVRGTSTGEGRSQRHAMERKTKEGTEEKTEQCTGDGRERRIAEERERKRGSCARSTRARLGRETDGRSVHPPPLTSGLGPPKPQPRSRRWRRARLRGWTGAPKWPPSADTRATAPGNACEHHGRDAQ